MDTPFRDREIVLGITGSIAAYKACDIASRLVERGACVRAVLSAGAENFIGAASLEGITGNPVIRGLFEPLPHPEIEHIAVSRRADLFLIAPATANVLAKMAHGFADDWLSTALLATRAPVLVAPAMNMHMYAHPATQANVATLRERDVHFVGPESGALACGDVGPGRLSDTDAILDAASVCLTPEKDFAGKRVLITSGANHEPIDPVRYLGNRSSGKMGRALALTAMRRGAEVTVVQGPSTVSLPCGVRVMPVETAREMLAAVEAEAAQADVFIFAAAVADYHAPQPDPTKHKRGEGPWTLTLEPNPDIAATIGQRKRPDQVTVGFAAETDDLIAHATAKLKKKNLDLVLANAVSGPDNALGADRNPAWIVHADGHVNILPAQDKAAIAWQLLDAIAALPRFHPTS